MTRETNIMPSKRPTPPESLRFLYRKHLLRPSRYRNLFNAIHTQKSRSILEVGVFDGHHARMMIQTAAMHHPPGDIHYYGFDLFEDLSNEELKNELSKKPPAKKVVANRLEKLGCHIHLFQGYTRDTLPAFIEEHKPASPIDFIFIDGGHKIESIQSDWDHIQPLLGPGSLVIFDDYYTNTHEALEGFGCQSIVEDLDRDKFKVTVLKPENHFRKDWGMLQVNMVSVKLKG